MAMRRVEEEAQPQTLVANPIKRVADFDDSCIRRMLRSAYTDIVGEALELQMNQDASSSFPLVVNPTSERGLGDLSHLQNCAELKLFWDLFVKKQIFLFEQESALLIEASKDEPW